MSPAPALASAALCLALVGAARAFAQDAPAAPESSHPYFDDRGALAWNTTLAGAQEAARREGKLILIEFGRLKCGNCRSFVERVVPDARVRERLARIAVGLAAECDPPGRDEDVARLLFEHIPDAKTLPFVGLVTADLEWVAGYSGRRDATAFLREVAKAEKSPSRPASKEEREKLEKLRADAEAAFAKDDFRAVVAAARAADATGGRCAERDALDELRARAAGWAEDRLAGVEATLRSGSGDVAEAKKRLQAIARDFAGEPVGDDAKRGSDAVARREAIDAARAAGDAAKAASLREKARADLRGTRWAALFREE
jgi:hypothetical protein